MTAPTIQEPIEDAPIHAPPDHGCEWRALVRCRLDYPPREQQVIDMLVQRALRGIPPAARPARRSQRARWQLHRVLVEAFTQRKR